MHSVVGYKRLPLTTRTHKIIRFTPEYATQPLPPLRSASRICGHRTSYRASRNTLFSHMAASSSVHLMAGPLQLV